MCMDRLFTRKHRLARPVISVGNVTFGGTGKTPFVIALGRRLQQENYRVAVLTRGYRKGDAGCDEPAVLTRSLPDARILVSPDRYGAALRSLTQENPPEVFILDDGFQHWALEREVDVVLLDAIAPFGLGRVFPAGLLREPVRSLNRAHLVLVTRADLVPAWKVSSLLSYVRARFPHLVIATATERITHWRSLDGMPQTEGPRGPVLAACGIGNPASFFKRLEHGGVECAATMVFADHHRWRAADVAAVEEEAASAGTHTVVTTAKDASKIDPAWAKRSWLVMEIEVAFLTGETAFMAHIRKALSGDPNSRG